MILNLLITGFFEIMKVYAVRHMVDEWLRIKRKKKEIKDKTIHCHPRHVICHCESLSLLYSWPWRIFVMDKVFVKVTSSFRITCTVVHVFMFHSSTRLAVTEMENVQQKQSSCDISDALERKSPLNAAETVQTKRSQMQMAKYFVVLPQLHVTCFKETSLFLWRIPGFRWQMTELQSEKHRSTHRWTFDEFW